MQTMTIEQTETAETSMQQIDEMIGGITPIGNWTDQPCFYVSAVDAGRVALLLGPFRTEAECREWAYSDVGHGGNQDKNLALMNAVNDRDPWSHFYSYGMVKLQHGHREGILNKKFGI